MRQIEYEGTTHEFPDDTPDEVVAKVLKKFTSPPSYSEVIKSVPGEAKRQMVEAVSGAVTLGADLGILGDEQRKSAAGVRAQVQAEREAETPKNMTLMQEGVQSGASSVLTQLPAMAVGGAAVPIAAAKTIAGGVTSAMGIQTGLQKFGETRDAQFGPTRSGLHALFHGLVEKYTEYLPIKDLVGKPIQNAVRGFIGKEMLGEEAATLLQDLNDKVSTKPNMTIGDWLHDAAVTAIATGVSAPVQAGMMRTTMAAMSPFIKPDQLTAEQKQIIDAASAIGTSDGATPTPLSTPAMPAGAVNALPPTTPTVDLTEMSMPDKTPVSPEGTQRVYAVVGPGTNELSVWTPDLSKVQEVVNVAPNMSVAYVDMKPEELTAAQAGEKVQTFRSENQVGHDEYVLPTTFATKFLYTAPGSVGQTPPSTPPLVGEQPSGTVVSSVGSVTPGVNSSKAPKKEKEPNFAVIHKNDDAKTKVRIVFPDEISKTLFLYAKHLLEGATSYISQQQLAQERETLTQGMNVPADELVKMATYYHSKVAEVANGFKENGTMRPAGFSPAVYNVSQEIIRSPNEQTNRELAKANNSPGQVLIGPNVEQTPHVIKMQAFLQRWMTMFAPGTKMTIAGVAAPGGVASVTRRNDVSLIRLPPESGTGWWSIFSAAHEFGHHIFFEVQSRDEYAQAVAELKLEHQHLLARIPNMTVEEFIDEWMAPNKMVYKRHVYEKMGVKPTDPAMMLVQAVDNSKNNPGYMLSFDEYAAEQFARYVGKNRRVTLAGNIKQWFEEAKKQVEAFFIRVVAKISPQKNFEKFVDTLLAVPIPEKVYQEQKMQILSEDSYFDSVEETQEFTTRVLDRLPKKNKWQRLNIVGELARQDVKDQERKLLQSVLDTFDGDVIDATEFKARVLEKIIPITTRNVSGFATYGLHRIGITRVHSYGQNDVGTPTAVTQIFDLPFDLSTANHFNDPKYFGHSRYFTDKELRSIVELQSDLAQKNTAVMTKEGLASAIEEETQSVEYAKHELQKTRQAFTTPDLNERSEHGGDYLRYTLEISRAWGWDAEKMEQAGLEFQNAIARNLVTHIPESLIEETRRRIGDSIVELELRVAERETRLQNLIDRRDNDIPGRMQTLPKRWWEFMLRKMNSDAARDGMKKMRMASADTIAKVEGWTKTEEFKPTPEQFKQLEAMRFTAAELGETEDTRAGVDREYLEKKDFRLKNLKPDSVHIGEWNTTFINDAGVEIQLTDEQVPSSLVAMIQKMEAVKSTYGRAQGIYDRYKDEITKFVKKEFGAKEINDQPETEDQVRMASQLNLDKSALKVPGNTWLEWDVNPKYGEKPIEYYDLIESMENAGDLVGANTQSAVGEDVPDMPNYFKRFNAFFLNALQLNQIAKLLPHVQPLQTYRRLMQSMANLKNQLMDGPNARIKEWYSLSKNDSTGIQQMLRDEANEGVHWTTLEQHQVIVAGKPMVMWIHSPSERLATEARTRGISDRAITVYLGIKNDLLTTLGTMEQTILNSIEEFFRNNPIAGTARMNVVRAQFAEFRRTPYLPDKRIGQWSVVVRARETMVHNGVSVKRNEVVYFSGHQRRFQQKREFAELSKKYGGQFAVTMEYVEDLPYIMRSLPREFIRSLPEQLQLTPEQMARYEELYYDITKEGKYLQLLGMGKKKVPGGPEDLRQAYSNYMWRTANLIAKMAFNRKLQRETYNLNRVTNIAAKSGGDVTSLRRLHEYLVKNLDYVMRPQHEWEQLRAFVSLWYLWGVPKTALMNTTTIVTTAYPRLAAIAGDAQATTAIIKAIKDVAQYWRDPSKISTEVAALFAQARSDGVTNQSFAAELAAVADGNAIERIMPQYAFLRDSGVKDTIRRLTWKTIHWGMLPFRITEEFNRRVTLLAAYRIERALGKPGITESVGSGSAYLGARDTVDYTQNEYAPWNRAAFLRGKKSVALIFYSFVQNMSFFLFGGDKGWWRGLLVIAALAGVEGVPGAENIFDFLDWIGRKTFGEPVNLRVEARELAQAIGLNPDYVMHGAMHSSFGLGWDTATSVGMGRIIPGTDAIFGQGDANQRIVQMAGEVGGPFSSLSVALLQALFDDNPNTLLRFDRALPPLVRNIERGYRGASDNQWTDTRGRALVDEATGLEIIGQLAGFSPTSKSSAQESIHNQKETAQFYVLRRTNLVSALFQASVARDTDAIADAKESIREYNSIVPDPQLRITSQEIAQSMRARQRAAQEVNTGIAASKRYRALYEAVGSAFAER